MQTKFYTDPSKPIWDDMKGKICQDILDNICGESKSGYQIHFDKMLYSIGWFVGYVEIWKWKIPHERNSRKIPFVIHVTDWGRHEYCKKIEDYRVRFSQNPWLSNLWHKDI